MGYVLAKEDPGGRIYALITPTRLIDYTLDIDTASVFQDKNEAEDLQKRATKKLRGFQTVDLRYQAGILGHSMTEMKAFFTSDFNTLKIRSMVLRLHFEYLQKKVIHCSVISYK